MARVGYVTTAQAQGDAREILAAMEARGSEVLNLHRTLANDPNVIRNFLRLGNSLLMFGLLPPALRELAILRVAQMTGASYEWAHHIPIAREAGVSEEQIAALKIWPTSPHFDKRERAALHYVESVASLAVSDEVFAEARGQFSEAEVVELTLVAGYWGMVARLLLALQVDVEPSVAQYLPRQGSKRPPAGATAG